MAEQRAKRIEATLDIPELLYLKGRVRAYHPSVPKLC